MIKRLFVISYSLLFIAGCNGGGQSSQETNPVQISPATESQFDSWLSSNPLPNEDRDSLEAYADSSDFENYIRRKNPKSIAKHLLRHIPDPSSGSQTAFPKIIVNVSQTLVPDLVQRCVNPTSPSPNLSTQAQIEVKVLDRVLRYEKTEVFNMLQTLLLEKIPSLQEGTLSLQDLLSWWEEERGKPFFYFENDQTRIDVYFTKHLILFKSFISEPGKEELGPVNVGFNFYLGIILDEMSVLRKTGQVGKPLLDTEGLSLYKRSLSDFERALQKFEDPGALERNEARETLLNLKQGLLAAQEALEPKDTCRGFPCKDVLSKSLEEIGQCH
jgi:hypothetical protein